jgi:hypothetical protein
MPLLSPRRPHSRPVHRQRRLHVAAPALLRSAHRPFRATSRPLPSAFLPSLLALAAAIVLAGGYLALEISADVLRYRIDEERAAIERVGEQIRMTEARIDELIRIAPLLENGPVDLLINP